MADATGSAASTMRAGDVGRAARNDLQFRIPRKPAVRRGVRMRFDDGAWVLDGGRKNQTLGGRFAREHLGALLQACDGTRTLAEIGEATGIGPQGAFEAVCLLWTGGILEEGGPEPLPDPQPAPELACLLSRLGDSTGVNDSWQDAARRLAAARVAVLGDAGLAEELARALEPTLTARSDVAPEPDDTLAVVVETDAAPTADAARRCWTLGIPLLRVRAEQDAVTVGPYVDPGFSPCLECATAGEPALEPPPGPHRRGFVAGLAARAVAALVSRATITHLPGDARRTDLNTFTYTDRPVVTRPGCPVCSVAGGSSAPIAPSAPVGARYEQSVAIPPAAFVDSKGHQQHYKPSNLRLQREFRDWPACPRTPLPAADLKRLERPWSSTGRDASARRVSDAAASDTPADRGPTRSVVRPAGPTLVELATVLALAVGVREPTPPQARTSADSPTSTSKMRRWTAAGGNIGSVTAYVLAPARSEADGGSGAGRADRASDRADGPIGGAADESGPLTPGVHAYIESDHTLALIGPPAEIPDDAGVRLVLTGNVDKVARKYLSFALRIAIQDCGCSLEVVRLVARCLDLPLRTRARWDERELAAAIGTDPTREPVFAVIDLGGNRAL